ncbi:MAG: hypothetical protein WC505_07735 [Patescibacteria group bacterium]
MTKLKLFHVFEDITVYHWKIGDVPIYYCDEALLPEPERGYWYTTDPDGAIPYNFDVRLVTLGSGPCCMISPRVFDRENPSFRDAVLVHIDALLRRNRLDCNKIMDDLYEATKGQKKP